MFGMLSGKNFKDEKEERNQKSEIRDLLTGDLVEIYIQIHTNLKQSW